MNLRAGMKVRDFCLHTTFSTHCSVILYLLLTYAVLSIIPKASENAAFDSAAVYFKAGRTVLGSEGWDTDQRTMLKLCSGGANACFISGDVDTTYELINEVLNREDIPVLDKFDVYEVKILTSNAAGMYGDSINTAFSFRKQLGLPTIKNKPVGKLMVMKELIKTKRALGNMTAEDIASLPELTDDKIIEGQRMLELASISSYAVSIGQVVLAYFIYFSHNHLLFFYSFQVQPTMFPLIIFHMVRATLQHGINASSCGAFGGLGIILW